VLSSKNKVGNQYRQKSCESSCLTFESLRTVALKKLDEDRGGGKSGRQGRTCPSGYRFQCISKCGQERRLSVRERKDHRGIMRLLTF